VQQNAAYKSSRLNKRVTSTVQYSRQFSTLTLQRPVARSACCGRDSWSTICQLKAAKSVQSSSGYHHHHHHHDQSDIADLSGVQRSASSPKRKHNFLGYLPFFGTCDRKPFVRHHLTQADTSTVTTKQTDRQTDRRTDRRTKDRQTARAVVGWGRVHSPPNLAQAPKVLI